MFLYLLGLIIMIIGVGIAAYFHDDYEFKKVIITFSITIVISIPLMIIGLKSDPSEYPIKDTKSNHSDEIIRIITITAEDGRIIYEYEGAVDIGINKTDRTLQFEDENGKRQIIIYGMQDTVKIIEK